MDNLKISGISEENKDIIIEKNDNLIIEDDFDVVKINQVNTNQIKKDFSIKEEDKTVPRAKKATFKHSDSLEGRPGNNIDFKFAISEDGKITFDSLEEFTRYMSDPQNAGAVFFVFDEGRLLPYCIRKEEDGFSISEDEISASNQLQDPAYRPRKSIALSDNLDLSRRTYHIDRLGDAKKEAVKGLKKAKKDQEEFAKELEIYKVVRLQNIKAELSKAANKTEEEYGKAPEEFTEERPVFPTGAKVQRFFLKLFTLGFGETSRYKEFKVKIAEFTEREQAYRIEVENYRKEVRDFDERKNAPDQKLIDLEEGLENAKNIENQLTEKIPRLEEEIAKYSRMARSDQDQLNRLLDYHRRKEVILEGIADINEKGKLTQNNIFANIWLLRQSLDGKDPNHMTTQEYENLASYVVCRMAEKQIYNNYVNNPDYAEGQMNNAILTQINNGVATEGMLKNPHFINEFRQWVNEGKTIHSEDFAKAVEANIEKDIRKSFDPLEKLKAERDSLEERFGRKSLTEDVLLDYARYRVLSEKIDRLQKTKNTGRPFDKATVIEVNNLIADVHMNPNEEFEKYYPNGQKIKMNMPVTAKDLHRYTGEEYKEALKNVIGRQEDTKKLTNEIKNSQAENMKGFLGGLNTDGKFSLPEIARFITAEHENMKNAAKNPPVNNGPVKL